MDSGQVIIVGGGIGGLATGLMLGRAGLEVRVLERDDEFAELGFGLQLAPNATRLLRDYGLLDDVMRTAVRPRRLVAMNALSGQRLTTLDLGQAEHRRVGLDEVVAWMGPGMHLVQYALRRGELYNQVAVFGSQRYRRGESDWGTPEELERVFSVACEQVRVALPGLLRNRRWPMHDRLPAPGWSAGRVTLLGDAAHPMLQYLAQGACQAIQDGAALANELARLPRTAAWPEQDVKAALRGYEERRLEQASRVQRTARTWGEIWHVDGLAMALRDEAFRMRASDDFRRVEWLWGESVA